MVVKVERCWGGGEKFYHRLILPDGRREFASGDEWNRAVAKEALDVLENVYGYDRKSVRFEHH